MPKISQAARIAAATVDVVPDIPVHAYVTWGTVVEEIEGTAEKQVLDGVPGLLWRGSLTDVINGLWPDLREDADTRRAINGYLRQTENMLCLKRNRTPLWWVRAEWNQIDITLPRGFKPVSTGRRKGKVKETPTVQPVVSMWSCKRDNCQFTTGDPAVLEKHEDCHVEVDKKKLTAENQSLRAELAEVRAMLAGIKSALSGG